ncbi:hypothetical protein M405DRAFT_834060 [Rhizopogon salebrosus TDB-379]|nr:hypothetical protein M405DRAFT_834060 [Rhizopogon salebrosus TDB-379]
MYVSQRVLDYQDIAVFEILTVHISKSSQQAIGRGQVHEIFTEDGERCRPSVGSVMDHLFPPIHQKQCSKYVENAKRPCVIHQLAVYDRYVASFPHKIMRARGSIDHHKCTKGVEMKPLSNLALHEQKESLGIVFRC